MVFVYSFFSAFNPWVRSLACALHLFVLSTEMTSYHTVDPCRSTTPLHVSTKRTVRVACKYHIFSFKASQNILKITCEVILFAMRCCFFHECTKHELNLNDVYILYKDVLASIQLMSSFLRHHFWVQLRQRSLHLHLLNTIQFLSLSSHLLFNSFLIFLLHNFSLHSFFTQSQVVFTSLWHTVAIPSMNSLFTLLQSMIDRRYKVKSNL